MFFGSCSRGERPDPQQAYRRVELTFLQGDLPKATQEADEEYRYYSGKNRDWAWQFRILEAKILAYRRLSKEALSNLDFQLPADLSQSDLAVRKDIVQGLVLARLGRDLESAQYLRDAQHICDLTHSPLAGELAHMNGVVASGHKDYPAAEVFFRSSLQIARQQKDQLLETMALINLGYAAMRQAALR